MKIQHNAHGMRIVAFLIMVHVSVLTFSQTFYNARDLTTNNMYENALHSYMLHYQSEADYWLNYLTGFVYQHSHPSSFGETFMPVNKQCIEVREDGKGDVNSLWFDLSSSAAGGFDGTFCLKPKRVVYAMLNQFHLCLDPYICGLWFEANFAYEHVRQDLQCEAHTQNHSELPEDLIKAVSSAGICCGSFTKTSINDVEFKGGWDYVWKCKDYVGAYIVGTVPTKRHEIPVNDCFFKPVVGTNHGSCGFGLKGGFTLWSCDDRFVTLMTDMKYRYVFTADEIRAFDLEKNGAWSNYLLLAKRADPSSSFHNATLFTQKVSVTPRSTIDWWTGLNAHYGSVGVEVGYDLWWRETERITDIQNQLLPRDVAIFDIAGGATPVSASTATIAQGPGPINKAQSDTVFTSLALSKLDPNSAAQQSAMSHTFYGAVSWGGTFLDCPVMLGFGGSYELAARNQEVKNTIDQWSIFIDGSINF